MIFKCPCGFQNYVDALPADYRVTCEGCHKTWVVSKKGKKRRRLVDIVQLSMATACCLIPATWPLSPILLGTVGVRVGLLKRRYKPWIRTVLTGLNAGILALIGGVAIDIIVPIGLAVASTGAGRSAAGFVDGCLRFSIFLQEWTVTGLVVFGVFVVLAGACQFIPKSRFGNKWDKWQPVAVHALGVIAALGLWVYLAQDSVSGSALDAEARLEDRYLAALKSNDRTLLRIALMNNISTVLENGISPPNRAAFVK
jgi:hypothetical protein